ncbi:stalk domain-containing protein [Paenibacillus glucanolyticus]|uniref:stalk domain-containing protein n=1 Tax=Paenibacillus glucanolyticus TaxID=59843 RepID=UPI0034CD9823
MAGGKRGRDLPVGGNYPSFGSGKIDIVVNGENIATDVAPKNVNSRVMVPISTISKAVVEGFDKTFVSLHNILFRC